MAMAISSCGVSLQWTNSSSYSPGKGCKYAEQAVRALPIRILTVGKKRSPGVQFRVDKYIAKLKSYCHVDEIQIRSNPKNVRNARARVEDEDTAVANLIRSDGWVVLLDERGSDISSEQMAELLGDAGNTGFKIIILHWWTLWSWTTNTRMCKCINHVVFNGFESSNCTSCFDGTTLQVMDYSQRTKVSSLAVFTL